MYHDLALTDISLGLAAPVARPAFRFDLPILTVREIQHVVAEAFEIPEHHMRSKAQDWQVCHPRQVAMYLSREMLGKSYPDIARRFNKDDHTTILHACRSVKKRMAENGDYADRVASLRKTLAKRDPSPQSTGPTLGDANQSDAYTGGWNKTRTGAAV